MFNDTVRDEAAASVLCWLATVDGDGVPSVTPKEIFALDGADRVLIADIASAGSVRNAQAHGDVCVSFVDIFRQRGFKLIGRAEVVSPQDSGWAARVAPLMAKAGQAFTIRHVIVVTVTRIARIRAPSYHAFPDKTEQDLRAEAYRTYGVRPADT